MIDPNELEDVEPETITVELDPIRSLMLRAARNAGGDVAETYLETTVKSTITDTVEELYGDREKLRAARAQQNPQTDDVDPTDLADPEPVRRAGSDD